MKLTLQVFYPTGEGLTFDYDYCQNTHFGVVDEHIGAHVSGIQVLKPMPGHEGETPPYFVIATLNFENNAEFQNAQAKLDPVGADIANFYNGAPVMIVSEVVG